MYKVECIDKGLRLWVGDKLIFEHCPSAPALFLGRGEEKIEMFRGNFDIEDRVSERLALRFEAFDGSALHFTHPDMQGEYVLTLSVQDGLLKLSGAAADKSINRFWLRFPAISGEHVVGGGEQFSALDLRGKIYPIWTREQGVGRNKLSEITRLADCSDGGGGDYHTTFFPQPSFISSRLYMVHLGNFDYSELDFRAESFHEIHVWSTELELFIGTAEGYAGLLEKLSALLGRQKPLPQWAIKGLWLGVQGGTERSREIEQRCIDGGIELSAVWIQDWEGRRVTSFGKRLQWDWRWNEELYPGLDKLIAQDDVRWMGYINPYLVEGGVLFKQASENGYFVKRQDGQDYLFDFGEYDCGVVDLTMPEAFNWYKGVIKTNLIGLGFRGWMADFGEYLPADAVCANGETGMTAHNKWPILWAKCNREAVDESGEDCVFYMRAGAAGSGRYATLIWAGDQCVDWSEDDGLPSVITAALSLGMSGYGLHSSDIGGYTTLFHLKRDEELMLRWLEFACFTPVMRTHEGNRPDSNIQLYSNEKIISAAARLSRLHTELAPYITRCMQQNTESGMPVMRPLFLEQDADAAYDRKLYSYMLGDDMLVAPVVQPSADSRRLWLPEGQWRQLWTGERHEGGFVEVAAPLGMPPVFYKDGSAFAASFTAIAAKYKLV